VYYQDAQDLEELGWDRVVTRIWETIFVGYRSMAGIRTMARHWSDLLQVGAGCSPELADELVRDQVFVRADRDLFASGTRSSCWRRWRRFSLTSALTWRKAQTCRPRTGLRL